MQVHTFPNLRDQIKYRVDVTLVPEQEKVLTEYHNRTSCLWNYLIDALDDDITEYLDTRNDLILEDIEEKTMALINEVSEYKNGTIDESSIPQKWRPYMEDMSMLDQYALTCRGGEFLSAIRNAGNDIEQDRRPRVKNDKSAQAVCFKVQDCKVEGRKLTINGKWKLEMTLMRDVTLSRYETVIVCKRPFKETKAQYLLGPMSQAYSVLFVK